MYLQLFYSYFFLVNGILCESSFIHCVTKNFALYIDVCTFQYTFPMMRDDGQWKSNIYIYIRQVRFRYILTIFQFMITSLERIID